MAVEARPRGAEAAMSRAPSGTPTLVDIAPTLAVSIIIGGCSLTTGSEGEGSSADSRAGGSSCARLESRVPGSDGTVVIWGLDTEAGVFEA